MNLLRLPESTPQNLRLSDSVRLGDSEAPKLPPLSEAGSGSLHEKEKARLEEIIAKVNDLFEGDLTDDDQLVYVNNVIKGKLLESEELVLQASNNTRRNSLIRRRSPRRS
jgi:hypothetical protein